MLTVVVLGGGLAVSIFTFSFLYTAMLKPLPGIGALIALPLLLAIGWVFSLALPISFSLSVATALAVSAAIALLVMAATWLPTRRAIAIAPRDALWRE
jgi:hypothetical protein